MGTPRFLVQNYYNDVQFPTHVLSATENGGESWKVGALVRSPTHYYTSVTENLAIRIVVDCGSSKAADMLVVDRVTNLGGVADLKLQKSTDNFGASVVDVLTFTIPASASGDNTALSAGVRTPEGAYPRSFTSDTSRYWGLLIPAVASFRPRVGGFYLGPTWTPPPFSLPLGEDDQEPLAEVTETPWGWRGRTLTVPRRAGEIIIKLKDEASYLVADDHIRDQYVRRPMWIVPDDAKAERAFLAEWPVGVRAGFRSEGGGYRPRQIRLPYVEYEPLIA
jgi:hypothetical protein